MDNISQKDIAENMKQIHYNKLYNIRTAFTFIELVFVIVILGILAALAIPRLESDIRQEAQTNIISALQYTKNLALADDKTDPRTNTYPNADWQKTYWQLRFGSYTDAAGNTQWFYTISSNTNRNTNVNKIECATDTSNGKYIYHLAGSSTIVSDESPNIFLTKKYGINSIQMSGSCSTVQHVAFDHFGRLHSSIGSATNNFSTYKSSPCSILFQFDSVADLNITIEPQTGFISAS